MRTSTRWDRSPSHVLDEMVLAPALPYLGDAGTENADKNPQPSKAKVDTGVSYSESSRLSLGDAQTLGIWNLMKNADDPSHVSHLYRQYRDSAYCTIPKPILRRMRDVMIQDMRDHEQGPGRRKQKQVGRNVARWNELQVRRGA